jgi:hypothetical protein
MFIDERPTCAPMHQSTNEVSMMGSAGLALALVQDAELAREVGKLALLEVRPRRLPRQLLARPLQLCLSLPELLLQLGPLGVGRHGAALRRRQPVAQAAAVLLARLGLRQARPRRAHRRDRAIELALGQRRRRALRHPG